MADAKRLAKNTLFMYIRMILIMVVSIYTSRVVLDKLGIDDYGLYNAVASVVGMVIFLNQTLSTSSSRFIAYDLGSGDENVLKQTFSTTFFTHLFLAVIIILALETVGLWYMFSKFVIPEGRETAVHIVFQLSILMTAVSVCIVPYTGLIIAHENMNIYACVGIFDAFARLMIVYLLSISPIDKLVSYASLLLCVQITVAAMYIIISLKKYKEAKPVFYFSKPTFRNMMGFTGWTAAANLSNTFIVQGAILLLNLFFAPAIIAAKALADQISSAIMQFVNNFRVALNPQIIKSYAAGKIIQSRELTLKSTLISFDLMMIIGLPVVFTMETLLNLWLIEVPPMAVRFAQVAVLSQIINTISSSTYISFVASGKLKRNALWGIVVGVLFFGTLFFIFKIGGTPIWVQYLYLIMTVLSVIFLRPYLLRIDIGYDVKDVLKCYWQCMKVFIPSIIVSGIISLLFPKTIIAQIIMMLILALVCSLFSYLFMEKQMKVFLKNTILVLYNRVFKR